MQKQHKTVHLRGFPFTDYFQKQLDSANIHSLFISFLGKSSLRHWKDARGAASHLQTHLIQDDLSQPGQEDPVTKARGTGSAKDPAVGRSLSCPQHLYTEPSRVHAPSSPFITTLWAQVGNRGSERLHHLSKVRGLRPGHTTVWHSPFCILTVFSYIFNIFYGLGAGDGGSARMEVRELCGVSSLLPPYGFWGNQTQVVGFGSQLSPIIGPLHMS